jgi:uncharacterized protein (DUF302 family)
MGLVRSIVGPEVNGKAPSSCGRRRSPRSGMPRKKRASSRGGIEMSVTRRILTRLVLLVMPMVVATTAVAADVGLISKPSRYSVNETIARFEAAVKSKAGAGLKVFTQIDHAAAAKDTGLEMRPRTVIVFGNPRQGTPAMVKTPLLAIDLPMKVLVWEDDQARVWLSYNSANYLHHTINPRHGLPQTAPPEALVKLLDEITNHATK